MNFDWRHRIILTKLAEGGSYDEAAGAALISRQAVWKRIVACPAFAMAVAEAREVGKDERSFRMWLRHPFRGKRPPAGRGAGGKPRFSYGRR